MGELAPPLGAKPYYIAIPGRIKELAEAILRCRNDMSGELLDKWAFEIAVLSKAQAEMSKYVKEDKG